MQHHILAINPGSLSTKVGLFANDRPAFKQNIEHGDLSGFADVLDQKELRRQAILDCLKSWDFPLTRLSAVVGRGGILPPVRTGGYYINERMLALLQSGTLMPHASNLGGILAHELALDAGGVPALIYDAVSAGEFPPVAQITGLPEVKRTSFCHVLNSRAVAMRYASACKKNYDQMNLLVAHLGGGITMSVHRQGAIVDSLADDNGPFAPERTGSVPLLDVIELCYSGRYSKEQMKRKIRGAGGLRALAGTADLREIERRAREGDEYADLLVEAQIYQIAKGIGLLAPVLKGRCDAILLTGGLAHSARLTAGVVEAVGFIAPVHIIPGDFELEALAEGTWRVLTGVEQAHFM